MVYVCYLPGRGVSNILCNAPGDKQVWTVLVTPWVARDTEGVVLGAYGDHIHYCWAYYIFAHFPTVSIIICAINCGQIILN